MMLCVSRLATMGRYWSLRLGDDSLDLGTRADEKKVMYRPVRDLSGIPGSESLHICLTGYQRRERDDIMRLVSLMGARFSKPLIANQVTHLICHKYEGEKYELAKKVNIKLVNHRWLEDCLKAWVILPIDNYTKSGWELEILESEAQDSDEENEKLELKSSRHRSSIGSSALDGGISVPMKFDLPIPSRQHTSINKNSVANHSFSGGQAVMNGASFGTPLKDSKFLQGSNEHVSGSKTIVENISLTDGSHVIADAMTSEKLFPGHGFDLKDYETLSASKMGSKSGTADKYSSAISYSRKSQKKQVSPEEQSVNYCTSTRSSKDILRVNFDISPSSPRRSILNDEPAKVQSPASNHPHHATEVGSGLPQKRRVSLSSLSSKSPKFETKNSRPVQAHPQAMGASDEETTSCLPQNDGDAMLIDADQPSNDFGISNASHKEQTASAKLVPLGYNKKSLSLAGSVLRNKVSNVASSFSDVNMDGVPITEQAWDVQKINTLDLSPLNLTDKSTALHTMAANSQTGRKQMHADDSHKIMTNITNQFGSSIINNKGVGEIFGKDKKTTANPAIEEPNIGGKADNDEAAGKDMSFLLVKKLAQSNKEQQVEDELSPSSRDTKTKLSASTASAEGNNAKVAIGKHIKKAVAKRRLKSESKKSAPKNGEEHLNNESVKSHYREKGMEDNTEIAEFSVVTTNNKDANMISEASMDSDKVEGNNAKMATGKHTKKAIAKRQMKIESKKPAPKNEKKNLNESVKTHSREKGMEDNTEMADHPVVESNNKDVTMISEASTDSDKENVLEKDRLVPNSSHNSNNKIFNNHNNGIQEPECSNKMVKQNSEYIVNLEPARFLVSGHRAQRKEFQSMIRRLRGKACRNSHQWSYQATHLIVQDLRRTEKFFAAAAAGRWILKADYLTASIEAGQFLAEEPFEWHKKGLTEDGALSLEAPRKWRLLKERTGHGAFYGMQIVIYGECIAPTLDTLKRVIKAGDGAILATSPPYTRFLNCAIDYVIVSPSMPRVDSWVQEFLRHEIPCVTSDYLVEYVCKPGCSLEKHVLYKTHTWAEKSFTKLLNCSEEISKDVRTTSKEDSDDLRCSICGSPDRGEVMLICGNEAGTLGCGIGIHIDCCDPPLEAVPDGDWLCSTCCESSNKTSVESSKKKSSSRCK